MRWMLVAILVGCASEQRVIDDMERTLRHSHAAIAAHLVATELLARTLDEPTPDPKKTTQRHGESCGCPCIERIGVEPPWVVTVDYPGSGCVPRSGLVPSVVAGHAVAHYDGEGAEITFDALTLAREHDVVGSVVGSPALQGALVTAELDFGGWVVSLESTVHVVPDTSVTLSGSSHVQDPEGDQTVLDLQAVDLAFDDIAPCPSPTRGQVVQVGGPGVSIALDDPGAGQVRVTRRRRSSEAVDYCAYRSELL